MVGCSLLSTTSYNFNINLNNNQNTNDSNRIDNNLPFNQNSDSEKIEMMLRKNIENHKELTELINKSNKKTQDNFWNGFIIGGTIVFGLCFYYYNQHLKKNDKPCLENLNEIIRLNNRMDDKKIALIQKEDITKWINIAKQSISSGDSDDAIRILEYILYCHPTEYKARELYASILLEKGNNLAAIKQFEFAATYSNSLHSTASCYNNIGLAYSKMKKYNEALEYYNKAIQTAAVDDKNTGVYFSNRAAINQRLNNYQSAIQDYSRSINWDEHRKLRGLKGRATCYSILKQHDKALEDYTTCLELEKDNKSKADIQYYRGKELRKLRRYKEALEDLDNALKIKEDSKYLHTRAGIKRKLGIYEEAIRDHNHALKLRPNDTKYIKSLEKTRRALEESNVRNAKL
ncbi:hypothetical protein ABK040_009876 [Willaertia magna]